MKLKERFSEAVKARMEDEKGAASIILFPAICILAIMMLSMLFNVMWLSQNKYHTQLMLDSASRAATLAVGYTYVVDERKAGQEYLGLDGYHLYLELDEKEAKQNANKIIERYKPDLGKVTIDSVEFNPNMTPSYVWNSNSRKYEIRSLTEERQYKSGNFSIKAKVTIPTIGSDMYGGTPTITIEPFSQSLAKGKVVGVERNDR